MNKLIHLIYILIIALLIQSCSESTTCQISGKLEELTTNKLLLVFDDPKSKTDSVFITENNFFYTFSPDTITLIRLVNNDGTFIPIFADKGWDIKIEGSFNQPKISGNGPNSDYQEFLEIIEKKNQSEYEAEALKFVQSHPQSYASAYILNKYLIDVNEPDIDKIKAAIQPLHGAVKDSRILSVHRGEFKESENKQKVSYYSFKDRQGKNANTFSNDFSYTLINFWASWDKTSCDIHDSLYNHYKDQKGKDLRIINFSLDYDKKEWLKKCKKDSKIWIEICDFKAWNNTLVEKHNIRKLPANILIRSNRDIIGQNLFGKDFDDKIKELTDTENKK